MVSDRVVQQDQGSPRFEIDHFHVDRLSNQGIMNPDGLFLFHGTGHDERGTRPWSVVLKILRKPAHEQDPREMFYWKRELLAAQHHLLGQLPGPVAAPRIYAAVEKEDEGWLWMEHIVDAVGKRWGLEHFAFVAYEFGRFNAAYLTGTPLPDDYPWLCTEQSVWWLRIAERNNPDKAWENPHVREFFPADLRPRVERMWAEKDLFLKALNHVLRVLAHCDIQRRNLFIRKGRDNGNEVVAIDWAHVGCVPLGTDLFALVFSSAGIFEVEGGDVPALEEAALRAYLRGLGDAGWTGDSDLVRFGYQARVALRIGAAAPAMAALWTSRPADRIRAAFGCDPEAFARGWATLCALALDRADNARRLISQLGLG